jgi:hypothetical protein
MNAGYFVEQGCNNVGIGINAGPAGPNAGCNNVSIGPSVQTPVTGGSCQLAIGYTSNQYWLTGCSNKAIRPGAGIMDCTGSTGTVGQVLTSTGGNALQWAAPTSTKQYMSAYGGTCLFIPTTANAQRLSNWCTYRSNGIALSGGAFDLTANKTYLFNVAITPSITPNGVIWGVYCTSSFTLISPICGQSLVICNTSSSGSESSMSFIYTPTVSHSVAICLSPPVTNVTFFPNDNTITIVEI